MSGHWIEHECSVCNGEGAYYIVGTAGRELPVSVELPAGVDAELIDPCDTCHGTGVVVEPADDDRDEQPLEFADTPAGERMLEAWARRYDELNGAPEGGWDR